MDEFDTNIRAQSFLESRGQSDDWSLVGVPDDQIRSDDFESFKGVTMLMDKGSRDIVVLSTRDSKNADRLSTIPDLQCYANSLLVLDLHKCRYISSLHDSVGGLVKLRRLMLTRCNNLKTLPDSIGNLSNLTEVKLNSRMRIFLS